jgi:hypothetical protein
MYEYLISSIPCIVHCTLYNVHQYYIITASILVQMEVNVSLLLWYRCTLYMYWGLPWRKYIGTDPRFLPSSSLAPTPSIPQPHCTSLISLPLSLYSLSVAGTGCMGKLMGEGGGLKIRRHQKSPWASSNSHLRCVCD